MSAVTPPRRRRRGPVRALLVPLAAAAALVAGLAPPATAHDPAPPGPRPAPLRPADRLADPQLFGTPGPSGVVEGDGIELSTTTRPVAPGTELTRFDRMESDKWLRAYALTVDLDSSARVDYLSPGRVSARETLSTMVRNHDPGPGRRTVAAWNADFYDINATNAPLGPGIADGRLVHSGEQGTSDVVGVGPGSAGRILGLYFDGTVTLPDGRHRLDSYNAANVPRDGIGVYNAQWGEADRALTVDGASPVTEVHLDEDGTVTAVLDRPGSGPVPAGTTVLLGRERGAEALAGLRPGDTATVRYAPRTADGGGLPRTAVGGRGLLVVDGEPVNWEGMPNNAPAPRTAVGFSRDGSTMHVLTVDGRQAHSGGVTLTELALMMDALGAHNALNLDGGGSTTLLAREPGAATPTVVNSPSDGRERGVPNGLAVTAPRGSGTLTGFRVEPVGAAAAPDAGTGTALPAEAWYRVFPGLTRRLTAVGHDETYGPAAGTPRWRSAHPHLGRVDDQGVFHARRPGDTEVTAARGRAEGGLTLTVLGELRRLAPTERRVALTDSRATGGFGLVGYDAAGSSAPVEPSDARLEYDRSLFTIAPDGSGGFTVRARDGVTSASGTVRVTVRGLTTTLAVTVGLREQAVADLEDADQWTFSAARASGSLAATPDGHDGTGLTLRYDFTQSTATRAAYATPPRDVAVAGQPQTFRLWLRGDGNGAWPSLHLKDANGTDQVLRGPYVDWAGWRRISFAVPPGVAYPLTVHRFYLAETDPTHQYQGEVTLDELTALTPPDVDLPPEPPVTDPLVGTAAQVAARDWRFAVVSDAQFVARDPDSPQARQARRTLREVRRAAPDFVIVNGDWVDEGAPEDLAFAHRMLREELGDALPWYYVPGNHEVMGGSLDTFVQEFGPAHRVFDHKGTRFLTLDTSALTLRGGGWQQVRQLRRQLDLAARDPRVGAVVVVTHVPPRDPTGQAASQLTDRLEAEVLQRWLAEFRRTTGKGAAFVGSHVGVFHAERVDGVPYLVNGNAGKAPAAPADAGGFTGWSLVGVDQVSAAEQAAARRAPHRLLPDWITVQTRAHVDGLRLTAPPRLAVGEQAPVRATVVQGEGEQAREVPVAFPLSADRTGSARLYVGDPRHARPWHVAAWDPADGTLTGLRPGTVRLTVTVGGERRQATVTVTDG